MMKRTILSLSLLIALSGCALEPPLPAANSNIPGQWGLGTATELPQLHWKQVFDYPLIQKDVALALSNNKEIQQASLNALKAHQLIGTIQGPWILTASVNGDYSGPLKDCCVPIKESYGMIGLSFDLDIWGKIAAATKSATLNAEASDLTIQSVQNAIVVEVIQAHLTIAYANEYQSVLDEMEKVLLGLESKANARTQSGMPNAADLSRVLLKKTNLLAIRTQVEQQKSSASEALRVLTSFTRGSDSEYAQSLSEISPAFYTIPKTTSAGVLLNRPDIAALTKKMQMANSDIAIAKADRLPQVSVPFNLLFFTSGVQLWEVLPTITQTVFDGGRLKSIEAVTTTQRDITIINFEMALQTAFRDVANGLTNADTMERQVSISLRARELSQQAFNRTLARNNAGYATLSDLIDRYEELLTANSQVAKVAFDRAGNTVSLFAAAGAGV